MNIPPGVNIIGTVAYVIGLNAFLFGLAYIFLRFPDRLLNGLARYNAWAWKITQRREAFPFEKELEPEQAKRSELLGIFIGMGWFFVFAGLLSNWMICSAIWQRISAL